LVPDGYGSVNPASQTVAYGTNATINITPETDYHVASITHNANPATVANPFVISNVTGNYDVVVTFAINDYTVTVKKPTFQELRDFILRDPTNRKQFVLNQYECRHFATDVDNNAEAAGLRCAFVLLCYDQGQHAVVAFDTTDQGLVYIEPQTDARIYPEVGGRYEGKEIKEILIAW
jgi:hypothetical protein